MDPAKICQHRSQGLILLPPGASEERPWLGLVTCLFCNWKHQGGVLSYRAMYRVLLCQIYSEAQRPISDRHCPRCFTAAYRLQFRKAFIPTLIWKLNKFLHFHADSWCERFPVASVSHSEWKCEIIFEPRCYNPEFIIKHKTNDVL